MLNRMHRADARPLIVLVLSSLAWLMLLPPRVSWADVPPGDVAWVCVTDSEFVSAFAELAAYRESQGLSSLVVTMDDVRGWVVDGVAPDTPSTLRWFARRAHDEWGARYLVLGADYDRLSAPSTQLDRPQCTETVPLDLYYACLDGDWNGDGDDWVAEPGEAYDHEPELAVGRFPVDDLAQAEAVVAKTIAYEGRSLSRRGNALLSAAEMEHPLESVIGVERVESIATLLSAGDVEFATQPILQNSEAVPGALVLTPDNLIDQLADEDYDHVHHFSQGIADRWICGESRYLEVADLDGLADSGRLVVFDAAVPRSADIEDDGILEAMITVSDGGAAAARGFAATPYLAGLQHFDDAYWEELATGARERLGDVHNASLIRAWNSAESTFIKEHLPLFMLFGDPALMLKPAESTSADVTSAFTIRSLEAFPNPFNPSTIVAFAVDGPEDATASVRVEVFDLRGRRVTTLLDADLAPGGHRATWSAGTGVYGAGVYFARVTVAGSADSVKLVRVD